MFVSPKAPLGVAIIHIHEMEGMHSREFWFQEKSTGLMWRLEIWSNKIDVRIFSDGDKDLEFSERVRREKGIEIYNWAVAQQEAL